MRAHLALAAASMTALTAPVPAAAEMPAADMLANVSGYDASLLAGKTCQGVFESGRRHPWSNGAAELAFAIEGDRLTAQYAQSLGQQAHDFAEYAMVQDRPVDASGYERFGPVHDLTVAGHEISFVDATGARFKLTYRRHSLSGERDPRGGSDPRMTRISLVRMRCR
ncbi:MAG TPA: hypothetical protein VME41_02600 [Stellaceae bacterium]|nr:hypothetical protein [Stellaceae bacterium]